MRLPGTVTEVDESTFTYVQGVPMLLKPFDDKLQRLVPWLKDYVLQREKDWLSLPVAQTWDPEVRAARPRGAWKKPGARSAQRRRAVNPRWATSAPTRCARNPRRAKRPKALTA